MRRSGLVVSLLATLASAQIQILQFGSGQLPSCAQSCDVLNNAQTVCVPPAAPVTTVETYKSCFCQSGYLNTLSSDASTICSAQCTSQSDRTQIQSWYASYCANANEEPTGAVEASSTAASGASSTTAGANGASSTTSSGSQATTTSGAAATPANQTWWQAHSRWIAMVIVLIVGFALLTALLLWVRRRYRRKHYGVGGEAPPLVWGPHQNQHATEGVMYAGGAAAAGAVGERYNEKGKGTATVNTRGPAQQQYSPPRQQRQEQYPRQMAVGTPPRRLQGQQPVQDVEKGSKLKKFIGRQT